jgi:predicted nucleic acid-binding protein
MISLDCHTLIWGVQKRASAGQEAMIEKATRFFLHLDEKNIRAIVPSVVVFEYLAGLPVEEHSASLAVFTKRFIVPAFDLKVAALAGQIYADREHIKSIQKEDYVGRKQFLKMDVCILATARANGATTIICHDAGLKKLSRDTPKVLTLDEYPIQTDLFPELPDHP